MINYNTRKFDFQNLMDSINHFYPVGTKKEDGGLYFTYPGIIELDAIVADNIHNAKHFEERWLTYTKQIELEIDKPIVGTTYGQAPSFSSYVVLDKMKVDNLTRTKELHFCVSLTGPYYTIIGEDTNMVSLENRLYRSTNYLVVSPQGEFADMFDFICSSIERQFTGYRFVPFGILNQTIEGLNVRYSDKPLCSVYNALFNDLIDLNTWKTIGNNFYKSEDWFKEDYVPDGEGWKAYPPEK